MTAVTTGNNLHADRAVVVELVSPQKKMHASRHGELDRLLHVDSSGAETAAACDTQFEHR
jgi:hypothetical protein